MRGLFFFGAYMTEVETEAVETEEVTPPTDDSAEEQDKPESPSATAKATEAAAESPSDDAEADGESEPKEWVNLVTKYEGDKAKIGEEFWRATKANAELAKKVKELEARVATPATKAEEPKPEPKAETKPADHPSIQKLESTITALTTEAEGIQAKGATKYSALQKQDEAIIELKTRIKIEGDLADEALKDRLALAEDRRGILADQLESLGREFRSVNARLEDKKSQREAVRADAEAEGQRQKAAQAKAQEFNSEYPQRIDALIFKAADDLGVPDDPEIREDLWETANSKLMAKLFHLGKDVEITAADEQALVRGYVERFAKTHGFASKAKFAGASKEKAKVAHRITPGQPLLPRKTPNLTPGLVDDARAKDTKLMAARNRLLARFGGADA
jgi:hypothetical protein